MFENFSKNVNIKDMVRKTLLTLIIFILTIFLTIQSTLAFSPCLQKGSLIKVYPKQVYSTSALEEGSRVYFISPSDVWVLEQKAIEKGDIFEGYVSMLKMPVQGVNAALKINIDKLIKKDGEEYDINANLLFSGSEVLGGNLTNPASYNKTFHPRKVYGAIWGGTYQYVPSGEYEFGSHVEIDQRSSVFVQFLENYYI